jgi:tRNA dimethylallyltransferase
MSIGTAKPSTEEQAGIPHYFIDSHSIHQPITAADFEREALVLLDDLFQHHNQIILVGGSGLFIDALCDGLDNLPHDPAIREQLNERMKTEGFESMVEELKAVDPTYVATMDQQNPVRIIRALEVYLVSGKPFSSFHLKTKKVRPFEIYRFVLDLPRELLYDRINQRVDQMLDSGLLDEVKSLVPFQALQPLNTVGYSEFFDFLNGELTWEESVEKAKQNTRRYAKRQLTWFRKDKSAHWIQELNSENQCSIILERLLK